MALMDLYVKGLHLQQQLYMQSKRAIMFVILTSRQYLNHNSILFLAVLTTT